MTSPRVLKPLEAEVRSSIGLSITIDTGHAPARVKSLTEGYGCDVYIEATGSARGPQQGLEMIRRLGEFVHAGVQAIVLLALNDDGSPSYEHGNAAAMAELGIPTFACTPDLFPDLIAAAISRQDIGTWAATQGIVTARAKG